MEVIPILLLSHRCRLATFFFLPFNDSTQSLLGLIMMGQIYLIESQPQCMQRCTLYMLVAGNSHPPSAFSTVHSWFKGTGRLLSRLLEQRKTPIGVKGRWRTAETSFATLSLTTSQSSSSPMSARINPPPPSYDARRRNPKINGADLYVVRITPGGGTGPSKPCARCIEWCRWAGIKRVFHWDGKSSMFEVAKVSDESGIYVTPADIKLRNGTISPLLLLRTFNSPQNG
ncbi:uncharacterized protein EI90DRAFT_3071277 [Cantharellus anzutake]|uniref:uncharacterized protein n=1 Tax=Cantharellus anzutake TaxID=1750568 RepID=UPI001907AF24|nr:uncharacterized protein EI90DRAFT_3071277 [Cantharellus anzutake]KAF8326042.1 hypothetical protein EI90DRAFT_3071277 [Cantharellus anzutake]